MAGVIEQEATTVTPAEIRSRRNFRLGVWNGALYQAGEGFIDSNTVIPVFLSRLTSSSALIGMASSLNDMGWLLPQMFVAPWAARFPRQIVLYRRAALVRGLALAGLTALIWVLRDQPAALLVAFFACYGVFSIGAGFGGVAFMEVVARVVPARRLGSFWSQRMFWGGLGAAAIGLVVREQMRVPDPGLKFTVLFGLGSLFACAGYAMFSTIEEPSVTPGRMPVSPLALLRQGARMLRSDGPFRRLIVSRGTLSVWLSMNPFMVLHAVRDLGGGPRAVGTFLFLRVTGYVLANLLWQRLSRRQGTQAVMRVATGLAVLLAFLASAVTFASDVGRGWIGTAAAVTALEGIALLGGAAQSGMLVGYASLVLELAPLDRRQAFVSLANTFIGPTMFLPMLGGAFLDRTGPAVLFALCGAAALIGFRAALRLPDRAVHDDRSKAAALVMGDEP